MAKRALSRSCRICEVVEGRQIPNSKSTRTTRCSDATYRILLLGKLLRCEEDPLHPQLLVKTISGIGVLSSWSCQMDFPSTRFITVSNYNPAEMQSHSKLNSGKKAMRRFIVTSGNLTTISMVVSSTWRMTMYVVVVVTSVDLFVRETAGSR